MSFVMFLLSRIFELWNLFVSFFFNKITLSNTVNIFTCYNCPGDYIDGSVQDCNISIDNALEILQSCTEPLIFWVGC